MDTKKVVHSQPQKRLLPAGASLSALTSLTKQEPVHLLHWKKLPVSQQREKRDHVATGVSIPDYAVGLPVCEEPQPKGEPATDEGKEHLHSAACTGQEEGSNHGGCLRCKHQGSEPACSFASPMSMLWLLQSWPSKCGAPIFPPPMFYVTLQTNF